jgi:FkbM family methyltransferase
MRAGQEGSVTTSSSATAIVRAFKTRLPNAFEMEPQSLYGKLSRLAFYGTPDRAALAAFLSDLTQAVASGRLESLTWETVVFRVGDQRRDIRLDSSENNQLLGACRGIGAFQHGYEPDVACAIDCLTGPEAVIVDAGSNWGPITLQCALRSGFRGRIYSFEPQPRACSMLTRIVEELGLGETVRPIQLALSDRAGEACLTEESWSGNVALATDVTPRSCRMVRLDDVGIEDPQLIKIDVEGHESQVIDGAWNIIERTKPMLIFEDWSAKSKAHFGRLSQAGYTFYCLGWLDPFWKRFTLTPQMLTEIQVLGALPFALAERSCLPDRINVLAAADPISAGTAVEGVRVEIPTC